MYKKIFFYLLFSFQLMVILNQILIYLFLKYNKYKEMYKVECVEEKITDNRGNGFEEYVWNKKF